MNNELLENFREQIDGIDREILYLLFRRFTIVNEIGKLKKELGITPLQKDRWEKVLKDKVEVGKDYNLSEDFIKDIWNRIHKEALKLEK